LSVNGGAWSFHPWDERAARGLTGAREMWCACPSVTCTGEVSSCTGPDREWAECVMDSDEDVCEAGAACR
jgi:hypothetical protein